MTTGQQDGFVAVQMAVLTVSDSRTEATDRSGQALQELIAAAGHRCVAKHICPDNIYAIRAIASAWIADAGIDVILITGGTGVTGRDITPEAMLPLLDKEIAGFGELFRMVSFQEIGAATIQSRAMAGCANGTYIFCLPGSPGACRTAWEMIIKSQMDARTRPCNFVQLMPRLREI